MGSCCWALCPQGGPASCTPRPQGPRHTGQTPQLVSEVGPCGLCQGPHHLKIRSFCSQVHMLWGTPVCLLGGGMSWPQPGPDSVHNLQPLLWDPVAPLDSWVWLAAGGGWSMSDPPKDRHGQEQGIEVSRPREGVCLRLPEQVTPPPGRANRTQRKGHCSEGEGCPAEGGGRAVPWGWPGGRRWIPNSAGACGVSLVYSWQEGWSWGVGAGGVKPFQKIIIIKTLI